MINVKVKFSDTEFGMFEPSFGIKAKDGFKYRGAYLDFTADGYHHRRLVVNESMRGKEPDETLKKNPVYASLNDDVYFIISQIVHSQYGVDVEIEYEDEGNEEKHALDILGENENAGITLRKALLLVPSNRKVIVRVYEREKYISDRIIWETYLQPTKTEDNEGDRMARVNSLSKCMLFDSTLLLNRYVNSIDIKDTEVEICGDAFVFEINVTHA